MPLVLRLSSRAGNQLHSSLQIAFQSANCILLALTGQSYFFCHLVLRSQLYFCCRLALRNQSDSSLIWQSYSCRIRVVSLIEEPIRLAIGRTNPLVSVSMCRILWCSSFFLQICTVCRQRPIRRMRTVCCADFLLGVCYRADLPVG